MIKTFKSTGCKDFVRSVDYGFVKDEAERHGSKLRYFGLPSEGLYDVIAWNEFISDIVAVERGTRSEPFSKQSLLVSRALQLGCHNRLTLLRGDINQILIDGADDVGTKIPYPFGLVNLDYGGSVLYPDRIRIQALETLTEKQQPEDFLLLITSNVREFDEKELLEAQSRIGKEIKQYRQDLGNLVNEYFKQINKRKLVFRQMVHLHFLIKYLAEQNKYKITCFPAILYEGSRGTQLIHYIFRLRYEKEASTRVISDQSLVDLLKQDYEEVVDGKLRSVKPPVEIKLA